MSSGAKAKAEGHYTNIHIKDLIPSPNNPRTIRRDDPAVISLATSIRSQGVLQNVVVRPHPKKKGKYDLLAGSRRHVAAQMAGLTEIPAYVRDLDDQQALEITVTENLQREGLQPLEEARGIQTLLDRGWSGAVIAEHIGMTATWVLRRARLTHLSSKWRALVENPKGAVSNWPAANLEVLARLDADIQDLVLKNMHFTRFWNDPGLTTRELEQFTSEYVRELSKAPWNIDDAGICKNTPACSECMKRSSSRPGLFDELDLDDKAERKHDRCLDVRCWKAKQRAFTEQKIAALKKEYGEGKVTFIKEWSGSKPNFPDLTGVAVSDYMIARSKKGAKSAMPCIYIEGPQTGRSFWGVRTRDKHGAASREARKGADVGTNADPARGDPAFRRSIAWSFAIAHLVSHIYHGAWGIGSDLLAETSVGLQHCTVRALFSHEVRGHSEGNGRAWLKHLLDLNPKREDSRTTTSAYDEFKSVDEISKRLLEQPGSKGDTAKRLLAALALFDDLDDDGYFPEDLPAGIVTAAAHTFVLPRLFLEAHRKEDLILIAGDLGVKASAGLRREAIIEAIMKVGGLTMEIKDVFARKSRSENGKKGVVGAGRESKKGRS